MSTPSTPPRRARRPAEAENPETGEPRQSAAGRESRYRARPPGPAGAGHPEANRVLRLVLTEPDTVPITADQRKQAVKALSAMIVDWLQRQAHHGRPPAG
jgi:hypothetical protein